MSMTACAICGGTIDCSGRYWAVCAHCGKAVHMLCDDEIEFNNKEYLCPKCRKKNFRNFLKKMEEEIITKARI